MGSSNRGGRNSFSYVEDFPDQVVFPLDCVPNDRPKGSWTNGVKAWKKSTTTSSVQLVGWFHPPRLRNRNHHNRMGPNPERKRLPFIPEEE